MADMKKLLVAVLGMAALMCGCTGDEQASDIARIEEYRTKRQPLSHVWTQPMEGVSLAGVTDDRGIIVRCYRTDGKSYERLNLPTDCAMSGVTAKGRTYVVYDIKSERNVSVVDLKTARTFAVPEGFDCNHAMGNDVYLLKARADGSWRVWRPLEKKTEAWPYAFAHGQDVLVGGVALMRSEKDASLHAFGFGLCEFPDSKGVTSVEVKGGEDEAVVTLQGAEWNGIKKAYVPPRWDKPHVLQPDEIVWGMKTNCVEILRLSTQAKRWIAIPTTKTLRDRYSSN